MSPQFYPHLFLPIRLLLYLASPRHFYPVAFPRKRRQEYRLTSPLLSLQLYPLRYLLIRLLLYLASPQHFYPVAFPRKCRQGYPLTSHLLSPQFYPHRFLLIRLLFFLASLLRQFLLFSPQLHQVKCQRLLQLRIPRILHLIYPR